MSFSPQPPDFKFGRHLRSAREAVGLTLQDVASATGLTKGYISQIERDLSSPSVTTLWRMCSVLGITVGDLTEPDVLAAEPIHAERIPLEGDPHNDHFSRSDYYDPRFFASESKIAPGGSLSDKPYSIPGDLEFVYVLSGRLEFEVRGRTYIFKAGDAFTYSIRDPHRWRNPSTKRSARILWVAVPNPYAPRRFGLAPGRAPGSRPRRREEVEEQ
jgi:transcriptional regulator with XRE-family HTH domain